ncbi:SMI1/KNR4 family protein SUKH-1 [Enterobacter sp. AG5470]|nr:SMI1/KNR4 family protein SUKH-1 [Enterobacter sp. AG5470]
MAILTGTGVAQVDIDLLERDLGVTYPDDYKHFFSTHNGFRVVSPDSCDMPFNKVDNGFISFDALFGHRVNNENFDIAVINDEFLDELSFVGSALIIGTDPGDNFFVLVTEGKQAGVYYWDRTCLHTDDNKQDYAIAGEDDSLHLYLCSKTFTQFFEDVMSLTVKKGMGIYSGL